jgi:DHA2 family lincomycin resistance protein-like MFS transporter
MIGVLVLAAIVMILNETILSVALRSLTVELDVTATTLQWLTSGFLLTMAVVIPTTGFLLERFTPRQVFLASMTLFNLGTLFAALGPGFALLLVGRVVQACGTALRAASPDGPRLRGPITTHAGRTSHLSVP